jgi:hypothetical protein
MRFALYLFAPRALPDATRIVWKSAPYFLGAAVACSFSKTVNWPLATFLFIVFDLIIVQAKYFLNDFMDRTHDPLLLRKKANLMPVNTFSAIAVLLYACVRIFLGLLLLVRTAGLFLFSLAVAIVLLQITYELLKLVGDPARLILLGVTVALGYGVRASAGIAFLLPSSALIFPGAVVSAWASTIGFIFIIWYWLAQSEYYFTCTKFSATHLKMYKPSLEYVRTSWGRERVEAVSHFLTITASLVPLLIFMRPTPTFFDDISLCALFVVFLAKLQLRNGPFMIDCTIGCLLLMIAFLGKMPESLYVALSVFSPALGSTLRSQWCYIRFTR